MAPFFDHSQSVCDNFSPNDRITWFFAEKTGKKITWARFYLVGIICLFHVLYTKNLINWYKIIIFLI